MSMCKRRVQAQALPKVGNHPQLKLHKSAGHKFPYDPHLRPDASHMV